MHSEVLRVVLISGLASTLPAVTLAQPVPTLAELSQVVRPGETIVVTDTGGARVRGRLLQVSSSEVVVATDELRRFEASAVERIQRNDSLWNGTLIGAAVGGAIAALGVVATHGSSDSFYGWAYVGVWAAPAAGAATGALIDRASMAAVYSAPRDKRAALPAHAPGSGGGTLHVTWRF
jgi:hypothetical protein